MMSNKRVAPTFREGDEVVLAEGTYQGTLGVFLRLDKRRQLGGNHANAMASIRSHPMAWLAHAPDRPTGSAQ